LLQINVPLVFPSMSPLVSLFCVMSQPP
jgi:hypothetical protein